MYEQEIYEETEDGRPVAVINRCTSECECGGNHPPIVMAEYRRILAVAEIPVQVAPGIVGVALEPITFQMNLN